MEYQITVSKNGLFVFRSEWMSDGDTLLEIGRHFQSIGYRADLNYRDTSYQSIQITPHTRFVPTLSH